MKYVSIFVVLALLCTTITPIYTMDRAYIKNLIERKKSLVATTKEFFSCKQDCNQKLMKAIAFASLLMAGIAVFAYAKPRLFPANQNVLNQDLRNAASRGNLAKVQSLLAKGAQVNAKDKAGATALHFAAASGNAEIVKELLAKGADVNVKDKEGTTPLREAKNGVVAELLRRAGAQ